MQIVYRANNIIDAVLIKDWLLDGGILATITGEMLTGGMGELPASGLIHVLVPVDDLVAAQARLELLSNRIPDEVCNDLDEGEWATVLV